MVDGKKDENASKMFIKNIAALSDAKIIARIRKAGMGKDVDLANMTRKQLIDYCYQHDLWKYRGDVVPQEFKQKYGPLQRCGDEVSNALNDATRNGDGTLDQELLRRVARDNDIDLDRWSHCNPGQKVMNLGNVLRGMARRGEKVTIINHDNGEVLFSANQFED